MNGGHIIVGCMIVATFAYLLLLAAMWNQMQQDRAARNTKIDELLDKLKPRGPVHEPGDN